MAHNAAAFQHRAALPDNDLLIEVKPNFLSTNFRPVRPGPAKGWLLLCSESNPRVPEKKITGQKWACHRAVAGFRLMWINRDPPCADILPFYHLASVA